MTGESFFKWCFGKKGVLAFNNKRVYSPRIRGAHSERGYLWRFLSYRNLLAEKALIEKLTSTGAATRSSQVKRSVGMGRVSGPG